MLDAEHWEADLVINIQELKEDIIKQFSISQDLTVENKGNKKSALEVESGKCCLYFTPQSFQLNSGYEQSHKM